MCFTKGLDFQFTITNSGVPNNELYPIIVEQNDPIGVSYNIIRTLNGTNKLFANRIHHQIWKKAKSWHLYSGRLSMCIDR